MQEARVVSERPNDVGDAERRPTHGVEDVLDYRVEAGIVRIDKRDAGHGRTLTSSPMIR
jgi:hypothetical protein